MKDELKKAMATATEAGGPPAELISRLSDAGVAAEAGNGEAGIREKSAPIDGGRAPLHLFVRPVDNQSLGDGPEGPVRWLDGGRCPSDIVMDRVDMDMDNKDEDDTDDVPYGEP